MRREDKIEVSDLDVMEETSSSKDKAPSMGSIRPLLEQVVGASLVFALFGKSKYSVDS